MQLFNYLYSVNHNYISDVSIENRLPKQIVLNDGE